MIQSLAIFTKPQLEIGFYIERFTGNFIHFLTGLLSPIHILAGLIKAHIEHFTGSMILRGKHRAIIQKLFGY